MLRARRPAQLPSAEEARNARMREAREQLRLAHEARVPRVERELERDGALVLLTHGHGAVDGTVSSLSLPGHHAPFSHLGARGETVRQLFG
jgi:hypothetical protein